MLLVLITEKEAYINALAVDLITKEEVLSKTVYRISLKGGKEILTNRKGVDEILRVTNKYYDR